MTTSPNKETVERVRKLYPTGTRVELVSMDDPYTTLRAGDRGRVVAVDDAAGIHITWDSGSGLAAIWGVDVIKVVSDDER